MALLGEEMGGGEQGRPLLILDRSILVPKSWRHVQQVPVGWLSLGPSPLQGTDEEPPYSH